MDKSLIANTGIQFITQEFFLKDFDLSKIDCQLVERHIEENGKKFVEPVIVTYDGEVDNYVDSNGEVVDITSLTIIRASEALSLYQGRWIPLPYFIKEQYSNENSYTDGPIGWCRGMIQKTEKSSDSYVLTLAFDTYLDYDNKYNQGKHRALNKNDTSTGTAKASLVDDIRENSSLLDEDWLNDYLSFILEDGKEVAGISDAKIKTNRFYYFGLYLVFLKFLKKFAPTISIYDYDLDHKIDVDFVLDIGNSRSCGVLIESTQQKFHSFDFTSATIFHLRDLQKPHITYSDPFEMKVEFIRANFGEFEVENWDRAFYWPSVVRVGKEAINRVFAVGKLDVPTGMSSPKRYLWDKARREVPWYFNPGDLSKKLESVGTGRTILTEMRIDSEGRLLDDATGMETQGKYSRKAMMTFTLIEIFLQAALYINSFEFRDKRGNSKHIRVLRRIVLTTPTAMLNTDKKTFRECANEAVKILKKFYSQDEESIFDYIEIVPSAKDVITDPNLASNVVQKKEWGFDEATCVQLSFMYGEITSKYQNNSDIFFEVEGKKREIIDINGNKSIKDCVTVASLDIGGGTTDLMICSYINESEGNVTVVAPYPEFYEGFNIAGDDILKRIIERLILRRIEAYAREKECQNPKGCINFLFGDYSSLHTSSDKEYKKYITDQFLIPVALYALEIATKDEKVLIKKDFNKIIDELRGDRIKDDILDYVNNYFKKFGAKAFALDKIEFIFSTDEINQIITQVMAPVINKLSMIIAQLKCDYFIIAGQPSKLKIIKELVNRYLPITPDRVIPMGNYHIGKWYPFARGNGLVSDPKTTVAVGATVALMSGTMLRLNGFRLNTTYLKDKVKSTARYIGGYDTKNKIISDIVLSPGDDSNTFLFNGKTYLGMKQLNVDNWPGSCMYLVDFASDEVAKALSKRLPLNISLTRMPQNPEIILKTTIEDKNQDPVKSSFIVLIPQTLGNEDGYWLDTGIFHTAIY